MLNIYTITKMSDKQIDFYREPLHRSYTHSRCQKCGKSTWECNDKYCRRISCQKDRQYCIHAVSVIQQIWRNRST